MSLNPLNREYHCRVCGSEMLSSDYVDLGGRCGNCIQMNKWPEERGS